MENYYSETDVLKHEPLTRAQESELFTIFYGGGKGSLEARDRLIENNLRYAASLAGRHSRQRRAYAKDVMSAANLGLIKALESRSFDPKQGRFVTFATKWILGEIFAVFRTVSAVAYPAGKLPEVTEERRQVIPDPDQIPDENAFTPEKADFEALHEALGVLDEDERAVIEGIYFAGELPSKLAPILGISRPWLYRIRRSALVKLRLKLGVRQRPETSVEISDEREAA